MEIIILLVTFLLMILLFALGGLMSLGSIAHYALCAYSLFTISKKRNIKNAWLSWVPFFDLIPKAAIASLTDAENGKKSKLVLLSLIFTIIYAVSYALYGVLFFVSELLIYIPAIQIVGIIILAISIVLLCVGFVPYGVVMYIATYKLYKRIAPQRTILYFLISTFVPFGIGICLFLCRNSTADIDGCIPTEAEPVEAEAEVVETEVVEAEVIAE